MSAPAPDPLRDRVVAAVGDQYLIEDELGRGGMAVVYRALDVRLHRRVAIKVLPPELAYNADVRERFLREAQTAAALNHANIVPIFSVDERGGIVFFVMALVDGESVGALCRRSNRCAPEDATRILRDVADALAYAHAQGVVHRDIKPDNILIERASGRAMVTDFGIARAMAVDSRLTVTGVAMGTPTYMSPEQAMGERDVDGRSDQYSLAAVGFEMLAGAPPFRASNTPALLMKHVSEPPVPLWVLREGLPPTLTGALMRALAKKPDERWRDAAQFRDALAGVGAPGAAASAIALRGMRQEGHPVPVAPPPVRDPAMHEPYAGGGHGSLQDRARAAGRLPHEQVRSRAQSPAPALPELRPLDPRPPMRGARPGPVPAPMPAPVPARRSLLKDVKSLRSSMIGTGSGIAFLWAINLVTYPDIIWAIFPTFGMGMGLLQHVRRVRGRGATWGQIFGKEPTPELSPDELRALGPTWLAQQLVGREVLRTQWGDAVRRAVTDRLAIDEVVAKLSKTEREMIPEVAPTAQALVDRIAALAMTLHGMETDVAGVSVESLDDRIARARAEPASPDQSRRLMLLERQQATVRELHSRRATLQGQLESAQLALANLKLDLFKLRSAGISAGLADVNSATQQARAISRDIGHAVEAAKEVEGL